MKRLAKTIAIWSLSSLLFVSLASAETFLVAPVASVDADGMLVTIDGGTQVDVPYQVVTIKDRKGVTSDWVLIATVTAVTQGQHHAEIVPYKGAWEGSTVPFDFTNPGISVLNIQTISGTVQ